MMYPSKILHFIGSKETESSSGQYLGKVNPVNGKIIAKVTRGNEKDAERGISSAKKAHEDWKNISVIQRADILRKATLLLQERKQEIAEIVSLETGKSKKDALSEIRGAIELGFFISGEGRRFYGRTTTSVIPNRFAYTIRQPIGVAALIVPANTPIANVCWKAFPALLCGNTALMKASSDTPYTAVWFAKILKEAGLPAGVFSVLQGTGGEIGIALVNNKDIDLISFTGSTATGKYIQKITAERLVKVSLELGGKNPFVVCDDCDLEKASDFAVLSAFSNAGQRCASGSRIIVFSKVYEEFKKLLLNKTKKLKIGPSDGDDYGPVINERQLKTMLEVIEKTKKLKGARLLHGGYRLNDPDHKDGYYLVPTIFENVSLEAEISTKELFGPVTCLYKVKDFKEAVKLANNSFFGLTSAIHTKSIHRIQYFIEHVEVGVVSINGPTYGSEPHMPFGGLKFSGNGFREPGTEALDFYSEWKTVYIRYDPTKI